MDIIGRKRERTERLIACRGDQYIAALCTKEKNHLAIKLENQKKKKKKRQRLNT